MKKFVLLLIMFISLMLSACSNHNQLHTSNTIIHEEISNSTNTNLLNNGTAQTKEIGAYGIGIHNRQNIYIYDGNNVEIPIELTNSSIPIEVGIMVYIDGIPQSIYLKESNNNTKQYIKTIKLDDEGTFIKTAIVKPNIGKADDILNLHVITMFNPSYLPIGVNKNFGFYHNILDPFPIKLKYTVDALDNTSLHIKAIKPHLISDNIRKAFQFEDNNISNGIRLYYDNPAKRGIKPYLVYDEDNNIDLNLSLYGNTLATYRTTIFVNHIPVKTYENIDFFDMTTQDKNISTTKFSIGSISLNSFIYAITVPIGNDIKELQCLKTNTFMLLSKEQEKEQLRK